MRKILKIGIVIGLIIALSVPVSASSLDVTVKSSKKKVDVGKYTEIKGDHDLDDSASVKVKVK